MATFSSIFAPATSIPTKITAQGTGTSSAEVLFAKNAKIVIVATQSVNVVFGKTGMAAADATGFLIPSGVPVAFDMSNAWTAMRFWNGSGSNVDIYILQLAN